jgi:hypothetical protein
MQFRFYRKLLRIEGFWFSRKLGACRSFLHVAIGEPLCFRTENVAGERCESAKQMKIQSDARCDNLTSAIRVFSNPFNSRKCTAARHAARCHARRCRAEHVSRQGNLRNASGYPSHSWSAGIVREHAFRSVRDSPRDFDSPLARLRVSSVSDWLVTTARLKPPSARLNSAAQRFR